MFLSDFSLCEAMGLFAINSSYYFEFVDKKNDLITCLLAGCTASVAVFYFHFQ